MTKKENVNGSVGVVVMFSVVVAALLVFILTKWGKQPRQNQIFPSSTSSVSREVQRNNVNQNDDIDTKLNDLNKGVNDIDKSFDDTMIDVNQ